MRTKVFGAVPEMHRVRLPAEAARKAGRVAVLNADPTILYVLQDNIKRTKASEFPCRNNLSLEESRCTLRPITSVP